ncbi:zinc-dependent peptidase [Modicisalibacter tunisiensis]|uniref:M90 family metallopeptidase n=1 Tax=Modicisalibacter TaxID=574347 RepID=UPI0013D352E4|nr:MULTISPECIES: M90 family metallopeptidase [Modicisalibacter]MBZ9538797.1 zinc-dependent peptidase [Modicisalibacter tunisiensis]
MSPWHAFQAWRRRREARRHPLPAEAWQTACRRLPLLAALPADEAERLGERAWAFLRHKRISTPETAEFDLATRLGLAAQACLLTLGWSDAEAGEAFANVHEVVVVPEAFRRHVAEMDDAGVIHEYEDERVGETWFQGPVVISRIDLLDSGGWNGFNVVIHEFAHKLDMSNSRDADGFPPLPRDIDPREWHRVFTAVWDDLQAHLAHGRPTPIDDYAGSHPGECFAVCCELFFSAPGRLRHAYPALYALLSRYFAQDPLARRRPANHA